MANTDHRPELEEAVSRLTSSVQKRFRGFIEKIPEGEAAKAAMTLGLEALEAVLETASKTAASPEEPEPEAKERSTPVYPGIAKLVQSMTDEIHALEDRTQAVVAPLPEKLPPRLLLRKSTAGDVLQNCQYSLEYLESVEENLEEVQLNIELARIAVEELEKAVAETAEPTT